MISFKIIYVISFNIIYTMQLIVDLFDSLIHLLQGLNGSLFVASRIIFD